MLLSVFKAFKNLIGGANGSELGSGCLTPVPWRQPDAGRKDHTAQAAAGTGQVFLKTVSEALEAHALGTDHQFLESFVFETWIAPPIRNVKKAK